MDSTYLDILLWYEIYLILVVVVSLGLRFPMLRDLFGVGFRFPKRWPKMLNELSERKTTFARWTLIAPLLIAASMAFLHTYCNHVLWVEADLSIVTVWKHPPLFVMLLSLALWVAYLDWPVLTQSNTLERGEVEKTLDRGELALNKKLDLSVRVLSLGFVSTRKIARGQIEDTLEQQCEQLEYMIRGWFGRTVVRLIFGMACWFTWAYLTSANLPEDYRGAISVSHVLSISIEWR